MTLSVDLTGPNCVGRYGEDDRSIGGKDVRYVVVGVLVVITRAEKAQRDADQHAAPIDEGLTSLAVPSKPQRLTGKKLQ